MFRTTVRTASFSTIRQQYSEETGESCWTELFSRGLLVGWSWSWCTAASRLQDLVAVYRTVGGDAVPGKDEGVALRCGALDTLVRQGRARARARASPPGQVRQRRTQ